MKTESIACNNCGAPLEVTEGTNFATCQHCNSRLAVRRTGTAHFTEVLSDLQGQIDKLTLLNEIEAIDRKWEVEKEQYMVTARGGKRQLPSRSGSVTSGLILAAFGLFWTFIVASSGGNCFALFGVLLLALGIGMAIVPLQESRRV